VDEKVQQIISGRHLTVNISSGLSCVAFTWRIFNPRKTDCRLVLQVQHLTSITVKALQGGSLLLTLKLENQIARTMKGKVVNCKYM